MKKIKQRRFSSTTIKAFTIVVLVLLFIIPNDMVVQLIQEREHNELEVKKDIGSKWGAPQLISGPYLIIPYQKKEKLEQNGKKTEWLSHHYLNILPEMLNITGKLNPIIRKRGIYKAILYDAVLNYSGSFELPDFKKMGIDPKLIDWNNVTFNVGITDMGGIKEHLQLNWGITQNIHLEPGIKGTIAPRGVSAIVAIKTGENRKTTDFDFTVKLQGSESIFFTPLGKTTKVALHSSWNSPSFQGRFIPDSREVSPTGFSAKWEILNVNREFPQQWIDKTHKVSCSKFGVSLLEPIGQYQKNIRAVKYSLLIIVLIFLVYFFYEILGQFRIHPIQYSFIGLALIMFFVLLLSISEQLGFDIAYLIAAFATGGTILVYSATWLGNKKKLMMLTSFLVTIYGFIYVVLQLEDYALLVGSIGLFIALFNIMYFSRKIDWYNINSSNR